MRWLSLLKHLTQRATDWDIMLKYKTLLNNGFFKSHLSLCHEQFTYMTIAYQLQSQLINSIIKKSIYNRPFVTTNCSYKLLKPIYIFKRIYIIIWKVAFLIKDLKNKELKYKQKCHRSYKNYLNICSQYKKLGTWNYSYKPYFINKMLDMISSFFLRIIV